MKNPKYMMEMAKNRNLDRQDIGKKSKKLTFYVDEQLVALIQRYIKLRKKISVGRAIRELVKAGIEEKKRHGEL